MQTDPIGYGDGMNLYAYCGNNPVNWIDPWGLCAKAAQEEKEDMIKQAEELVKKDPPYFPYRNDCDDQNDRINQEVAKGREYWYYSLEGGAKRNEGRENARGYHTVGRWQPTGKAVKGVPRDEQPKSWILDAFHPPFGERDVKVMDYDEWKKEYPYKQKDRD